MCDLFVHHTQDHEAKELLDTSLGFPLVEPASRAAIGTRWKHTPRPRSSEKRSLEQCGDGSSSLDPERKRWHGKPSVLSQQRHESRDVGLLPQGHIAVKQGCYLLRLLFPLSMESIHYFVEIDNSLMGPIAYQTHQVFI
jgi:hypothetical protein